MQTAPLKIRMLGELSLECGSSQISNRDKRSRKLWLFLAYVAYHHCRAVSSGELIELLWGTGGENSSNPANALKTTFHRLRGMLGELGCAGGDMILRQSSGYQWNPAVPLELDVETFDAFLEQRSAIRMDDAEACLDADLRAAALYGGDFLERYSSESWVVPIASHYRHRYVQAVTDAIPLLERQDRWEETEQLCRAAIVREPDMEDLYQHLMNALIRQERHRGAVKVYEAMSQRMMANFGVAPSPETQSIYRQALQAVNGRVIPPDLVMERLREPVSPRGALVCDYEAFKVVYYAIARAVARSGDAVHLALISAEGVGGTEPAPSSVERVAENLQDLIQGNLRRGDVLTRCSASQFLLLLSQANFENSQMICGRIVRAFRRKYPHSPMELHCSVYPLEPNV